MTKRTGIVHIALWLLIAIITLSSPASAQTVIPNFTFIQISDEHFNRMDSKETIAELAQISDIYLAPYKVTAIAPSFIIETGDLTDFGPKSGSWDDLNKAYKDVKLERYLVLGNHDQTWSPLSYEITKLYGSTYYSFDKYDCHFIILNTAGLLDPNPIISPEELEWLKQDLARTGADKPIFIAIHHPLNIGEYSSKYETDRLIDILRQYNIIALFVGHGHLPIYKNYEGLDMVEGGTAWGPGTPGYQVVSVLDGVLRVAYKVRGNKEASMAMLKKTITIPPKRYPEITITSPSERAIYKDNIPIKAIINIKAKSAYVQLDGKTKIKLKLSSDGNSNGEFNISKLKPGAHYMRVVFVEDKKTKYQKSVSFYVESKQPKILWRTFTGSSTKSTPAVTNDAIYIGTNDGNLRAYNRNTGDVLWKYTTGGAVASNPLVLNDKVYFGSEDRSFYCVSAISGTVIWKYDADSSIYSSPATDGTNIYFGCASGSFYSINAASGQVNWKNTDATYNIESKPYVADGRVYYGCWDTYIYSLNTLDGKLAWKSMGQGSEERKSSHYYSPGDCGPVVIAGKVFAPDRAYIMSIIDSTTGKKLSFINNIITVNLSTDSAYLYVRRTDGKLAKIDATGKEAWSVDANLDEVPAIPIEVDGVVYVSSEHGLVSAVSAVDGKILWQYQATPSSYVLSGINAYKKAAYVAGTDGSLTAISM